MNPLSDNTIFDQVRRLIKDAVDTFSSAVHLLQARLTNYALSSAVFLALLAAAALLGLAAFVFLNIALGVWLARATGNVMWSVLILGCFYGILAAVSGGMALRWLKTLKS